MCIYYAVVWGGGLFGKNGSEMDEGIVARADVSFLRPDFLPRRQFSSHTPTKHTL